MRRSSQTVWDLKIIESQRLRDSCLCVFLYIIESQRLRDSCVCVSLYTSVDPCYADCVCVCCRYCVCWWWPFVCLSWPFCWCRWRLLLLRLSLSLSQCRLRLWHVLESKAFFVHSSNREWHACVLQSDMHVLPLPSPFSVFISTIMRS
jgi:hypothetical protein